VGVDGGEAEEVMARGGGGGGSEGPRGKKWEKKIDPSRKNVAWRVTGREDESK
jgi:hypothetical protein